jgi:hypothetical protein
MTGAPPIGGLAGEFKVGGGKGTVLGKGGDGLSTLL